MMDFTKISYEDFMKKKPEVPDLNPEILKNRQSHDLHRQMLDVWGEVDSALILYDKWKKGKAERTDLEEQLECVHNCCFVIYSDDKASAGIKWELKVAEWELYDFTLWDNRFKNNRKTVTLWFDEWCYDTGVPMQGWQLI